MKNGEKFLDGKVTVRQPASGFRAGLDAVMLAAAVPFAREALELGAGAGTASLCLASRLPDVQVTGIEIDAELVTLATANAAANAMTRRVRFVEADIFALPLEWKREYPCVLMNPPFHGPGQGSADPARRRALMDQGSLPEWLTAGLKRTAPGGWLTVIVRADRLGEALKALPGAGVCVFPLWPGRDQPAARTLIQVCKTSRAPLRFLPGLILHRADGAYTEEAEGILRGRGALALDRPPL